LRLRFFGQSLPEKTFLGLNNGFLNLVRGGQGRARRVPKVKADSGGGDYASAVAFLEEGNPESASKAPGVAVEAGATLIGCACPGCLSTLWNVVSLDWRRPGQ
jgi:hypothetical protein